MSPATRRIVVVVVGVVLALSALGAAIVLAVRGGESAGPATSLPAAGSTAPSTTAVAAPLAPLTGLPADPASLGRPALVVKIDDVDPAARPQGGVAPVSGTSFASPVVAARIAHAYGREDPAAARRVVIEVTSGARDLGAPARDRVFGNGLVSDGE